jgi:lipooligosaccharide transport system permease protein
MSMLANIDSGALLVWRRNADVFFKTWKTNFLPSILEPLLYLVAMGAGLGGLIVGLQYAGQEIVYIRFLAPGLVAIAIMYGGFFECTYGSFVRMHYQKTFDAIIATPISLEDVIIGEILWGATKSFVNSSIVLVVVELLGVTFIPEVLFTAPTVLLIPAVAFLGGLMFSSIAMIFTGVVPNIDSFNYPFFLLVTPMFLLGGTFFPISQLGAAEPIAYLLPLTHVSLLVRNMSLGLIGWIDLASLIYIIVATVVTTVPAVYLMKKRLIK